MEVDLAVAGAHGRLTFPGGWPDLEELEELAGALAETLHRCPDCADVPAQEFLLGLAAVAPPGLAAGLRDLARARTGPSEAEQALAVLYERYAGELDAIETIRSGRPRF
jgi:hypothetical protein